MGGCDSKETHFTHMKLGDSAVERAAQQRSAQERDTMLESALTHYKAAIDLAPNYHLAYMRRGQALQRLGRFEDAVRDFAECQELNPLFYPAMFAKAECYEELEEFDMAVMERARIPMAVRERRAANVEEAAAQAQRRAAADAADARRIGILLRLRAEQRQQGAQRSMDTYGATNSRARAGDDEDESTASIVDMGQVASSSTSSAPPVTEIEAETPSEMLSAEEREEERRIREYAKAGIVLSASRGMTDEEKYAPLRAKWEREMQRAHNVRRFMHGQRGIYVKSAAQRRAIQERGEQRTKFAQQSLRHDLGHDGYDAI